MQEIRMNGNFIGRAAGNGSLRCERKCELGDASSHVYDWKPEYRVLVYFPRALVGGISKLSIFEKLFSRVKKNRAGKF